MLLNFTLDILLFFVNRYEIKFYLAFSSLNFLESDTRDLRTGYHFTDVRPGNMHLLNRWINVVHKIHKTENFIYLWPWTLPNTENTKYTLLISNSEERSFNQQNLSHKLKAPTFIYNFKGFILLTRYVDHWCTLLVKISYIFQREENILWKFPRKNSLKLLSVLK